MGSRQPLRSIGNSIESFPRSESPAKRRHPKEPTKSQKNTPLAPIFRKSPRKTEPSKSRRSSTYSLFDDEVPEELSTFFEPSCVEHPAAKNLRPLFVPSTGEIFPEDDVLRDVPWIGVPSPTYSRKRKMPLVKQNDDSDLSESSSDDATEETEPVQRHSPRKRRKLHVEEPGFDEWLEKINAELFEAEKHDLTVEDT